MTYSSEIVTATYTKELGTESESSLETQINVGCTDDGTQDATNEQGADMFRQIFVRKDRSLSGVAHRKVS